MYKYKSGQISITDFGQPMGMHLNENNRWVKKAAMIPWNEIEKKYAGLFKSHIYHFRHKVFSQDTGLLLGHLPQC